MEIKIVISGVNVSEIAELNLKKTNFRFDKIEEDGDKTNLIWETACDPKNKEAVGSAIENLTACFVGELPPVEKCFKKKIELCSSPEVSEVLNRDIRELNIKDTTIKLLKRANVFTIKDLVIKNEHNLLCTKGIGRAKIIEIRSILQEIGLDIGIEPEAYPEIFLK